MNKISRFVSEEWRWILLYVMIGSVMYWTSIVIQPTFDILKGQQEKAIEIIANQNNNTKLLVELFEGIDIAVKQNQEIIESGNNNTALLVEMFERQNKLLSNQIVLVTKLTNATSTLQGNQILGNLSVIEKDIDILLDKLAESANKTEATLLNLILPAAMATEEEDIVGDILASENISRNPPEVNSTEVATGQISGFGEGPVVVVPP